MSTNLQLRKSLSMLAGAAVALPFSSFAAPEVPAPPGKNPQGPVGKPFDRIEPPVQADINRIRFLFSYDCPYYRSYHNGLVQWGSTLPKPLTFDSVPLITNVDNDNLSFAVLGRLIGQAVEPKILPVYDFTMYAMLQGDPDQGTPPKAKITITDVLRALVTSGANGKAIQQYLTGKGKGIENRLPAHAQLVKTYKLTVTPSVSLVGRYVVTPDHVLSDANQYLMLLNGMVSRIIQGGHNAL